ncbi:MAG TPA: acetyl-coenzyme A synthetase, partial [Saprospiraceae bacterium]|nr:acetyl-coenzyme A synthetase [Saprospiraceae bacterium]
PHSIKGQGIYAYVVCTHIPKDSEDELKNSIKIGVSNMISPIARPDNIQFVSVLPKTRSGKIMRRILKKIAADSTDYGDTSTLTNPEIVEEIVKGK